MKTTKRTSIHTGSMADKALTVISTASRKTPFTALRVEEEILLKYPNDPAVPAQIAQALFNLYRKGYVSRDRIEINGKKRFVYFPFDHTMPINLRSKRKIPKKKKPRVSTFDNGDKKPTVAELSAELNAPTLDFVVKKFLASDYISHDSMMKNLAVARLKTLNMTTLMNDIGLSAEEITVLISKED